MNIQITDSHLRQFLKTSATPKQIADQLSLCGPSVESLTKIKSDYIYDIEITTNRVDSMSVVGIAREAAAILPQFGLKARFTPPLLADISSPHNSLPITIKDPQHTCQRVIGIILDQVNLKVSKPLIQTRLKAAGIRSLNNVIDITNYVMIEIGHPTHVFDYDRLKTKQLILRQSKPGETIVSLENKSYHLPGGDNVIDDSTGKIIDLPGIIGTKNSIVIDSTKRILFFLETNDPLKIRQTSMTLGIRTMAATLNEKWVDPELAIVALKRGVKLFQDLTGARIASKIIDIYPAKPKTKTVSANHQLIVDRLGIDITPKKVTQILNSLGFSVKYQSKTKLYSIKVPSFRHKDIDIPEDIVEEVARIYGYHHLPSQIMSTPIPVNYPPDNFKMEHLIKNHLAGFGLNEIYTLSLVSRKMAEQSAFPLDSHLKIKNALSEDWLYLRRSLIPSHLQALSQPAEKLAFFEIANTYHPQNHSLPEEKLQLIISTKNSFLYLKGIIDAFFEKLHLPVDIKPSQKQHLIMTKNQTVGSLSVNPQTWLAVIDLQSLLKLTKIYPKYKPLSPHPPIIEDLTFTLPLKTYLGQVLNLIRHTHPLITKVTLTKIYRQNYTFNLTYQSPVKALTDKIIAPVRKKVVANLTSQFKAKLIGQL